MNHLRAQWQQRIAMAVPDFKGTERNMSERQVIQACKRILKDIARDLGFTGELPEVSIGDYLPASTVARYMDDHGLNEIVLSRDFWYDDAYHKDTGYDAFRIFAHEAMHALLTRNNPSYPGYSQEYAEAGAEVLAVWYWARNAPEFDDRDAYMNYPSMEHGYDPALPKWVSGARAMVQRMNYKDWVAPLLRRAASKVGWNAEKIVAEVRRVKEGNTNVRLDFRDTTNPDYPPPPGVQPTVEGLMMWLISGVVRTAKLAGQTRTLYRGLLLGDYSEEQFEAEIKRNPTAFVRQHLDTRSLGIHWTWDGDSAYNFATDRDPEGYVHDYDSFGDEDEEGGVTVGILIEAEVDAAHTIEEGTEEFADYAMSDAIFEGDHPEHEVVVRDHAPIRITQVEVIAEGKVEWSQVVPMSMVVAASAQQVQ